MRILTVLITIVATATNALSRPNTDVGPAVQNAAVIGERIWVFLSDKRVPAKLSAITSSPRTLSRMSLRGSERSIHLDDPIEAEHLRTLESHGFRIKHEIRWLNAVSGLAHPDDLRGIAGLPFVDSLLPVARFSRPVPAEAEALIPLRRPTVMTTDVYDYGMSRPQIAMIQVQYLHAAGLSGKGVRIGFMDTGFSLGIRVFECLDVIATRDFINGDEDVGDGEFAQMRHGTQTLSLCGGFHEGELVGAAPGAEYVLAKTEIVNQEIQVEEDNWVAGLMWLDSMGCDIVSSSLGYSDWYTDADLNGNTAISTIAADIAASRGVLVVNAAGNDACGDGIEDIRLIAPADGDSVLTIGAANAEGERASFSSCGPTADGRIKPDIIAPGVQVWTALAGDLAYQPGNGTSFATPLVSGLCALLLEQDPTLTPHEIILRLRQTATMSHKPLPSYGWGLVQAVEAASLDTMQIIPERAEVCAPPTANVETLQLWPNPAESTVTIVTPHASQANGSFFVYTLAGGLVYKGAIGIGIGHWNGRTAEGDRVAPGVYFVLVRTPEIEQVGKLAFFPRD